MDYFIENKVLRTPGISEMISFYDGLCKNTIFFLKKYYDNFPSQNKEHGFEYGEEQIKTFLTLALGKLTNYYFIQENPIERKLFDKERKQHFTSIGWTDYWATYKNATYLIEIKDSFIRYNPKTDTFTFYSHLKNLLDKSTEQINNVNENMNYNYAKRLIGLGLVIAPIFYSQKPNDDTPYLNFNAKTKVSLSTNASNIGSNIFSFWKIPHNYILKPEISDNEKYGYLGLAFIGRYIKFTQD